jgi:hypothetical protein
MALVVADRVWETTSTSGTGTLTLSGAVSGYQTFAVIGNGNTTYYTITNGTDWEVGIGTYTSSGTTLSRDTVLASSLGGTTKITVTPGSFVFVDYPASKAVYEDESGNVTGYPISGGTINGTTIGATTPSSIVGTTITGQTGVLRGTGQNLVTQSQTFSTWTRNTLGLSANSVQAPDGTTTAATFTGDGTSNTHTASFTQTANSFARTWSCYFKAGTNNFVQLMFGGDVLAYANFDLNAGTLGTVGANATATITSAGSGWYRCVVTTSSSTATSIFITLITSGTAARFETNSLSTTIFAWGAQFEIGSTANTYIPTTTTAVYGTPTLSFSGVSTLGLESNGALFLQPAGTGAIQAQATTSTTAGGNVRGANAVDWQTSRGVATRVASGTYTFLGGGNSNSATAYSATTVGGEGNQATSNYTFLGGGSSNTVSQQFGTLSGGRFNTAAGFFNFVGGGFTNSGTANAAVTTQSGTMNGTTAVTLSGSNASIRVGQYITGTSIASDTYVAAISGTSLTLSQNASGSSTSTLSFFTPHGVVVGGGNNQATGSYSFIGGGGDAGTAANRNRASGDWSTVAGGRQNTASGIGSFVGGGGTDGTFVGGNTASGTFSTVAGGFSNGVSGFGGFIGGGQGNNVNSTNATIAGGAFGTTRAITGNQTSPACNQPLGGSQGVSQSSLLILARQTTDATATALASDSSAASTTNQVILPNNSAYFFTGEVISGVTGGGNTKGWTIEGVIKRGANAASTTLVGTPTVTSMYADVGAATWAIAVTADTTNGGIRVTFTGQASTTIRTVCQIRTTEMTY